MSCPTNLKEKIRFIRFLPHRFTIFTPFYFILGLIGLGVFIHSAPVQANRNLPTDLSYNQETTWILPGLPDLNEASGYIPHNFSHGEAIFQVGNEVIHAFRPGKVYPEMYIRDIAWGMEAAQYYYPDEYLREPIEAYLRRQYGPNSRSLDGDFGVAAGSGAIGGIITPYGQSNKQTITTDEETSLIHAAYLYYNISHDVDWLQSKIHGQSVIERLNRAADWLYRYRLDSEYQLLWRGHTTDWGDVKFEPGPGYTDYNPAQDHLTVSIYDQALAYMALIELAQMNAAAGNSDRANEWQTKAETLKENTNTLLWQAEKGFYLTHAHVTPLSHDFDETNMVSISNALAVYSGLTDFEQAKDIFDQLERVRLEAGINKPGLSIYPFYPNQWPNLFFEYSGMGYGNYQNGGVWDWWGGVQIKAEFLNGFSELGRTHLLQVASEWQDHPGNIIEWHSSTSPRHEGSHYYSAAAGTMGSAIIQGFFGVELNGNGLTLQPRLGLNDGFVRVYQASTDRYAAYRYDWDQNIIKLDYGTNATRPVTFKILKLRSEQIQDITIDGETVQFASETVGLDTYTVFTAPPGEHSIEIIKGNSTIQPAAAVIENSSAEDTLLKIGSTPVNNKPNVISAPVSEESPATELESDEATAEQEIQDARIALIQFVTANLIIIVCLSWMTLVIFRHAHRLRNPKRPVNVQSSQTKPPPY